MSEQHKPKVLNLKSTNYKVPEGAVYIGRAMPRYNLQESKWHNPYHIGKDGSRDKVISMYESYIVIKCLDLPDNYKLSELTGHDLI